MNRNVCAALGAVGVVLALGGCRQPAPDPADNAAANSAPAPVAVTANTPDAIAAKAFLDGLYAPYKTGAAVPLQPFPLSADTTYDADLIALIKADPSVRQTSIVFLDPLCECGESEHIDATTAVPTATPTTATGTADFTGFSLADATFGQNIRFHLTFDLVKTPAGWRIHDIHSADTPSLRDALVADARQAPVAPPPDPDASATNADAPPP